MSKWIYLGRMNPDRLLDGRLKIRHLVIVTTIADSGSVIRAAEAMRISQPVVTRGLQEAEEVLGAPLFDRLPRGVAPTVYGRSFIDHARAVLAQIRRAGEEIHLLQTAEMGSVAVGTHVAGSNLLLPRAIAALKAERPSLTVIVREATPDALQAQLLSGELDMTVGRLSAALPPRLQQERLHFEPVRLVARTEHPAHSLVDPTLAELAGFPWVLPLTQTALRTELEEVFLNENVEMPVNRVECTSMLTVRELLISTDVIAALPMFVAEGDDKLRALPLPLKSVGRSVGVTTLREQLPSPAAAALLVHLRGEGRRLAVIEKESEA
jgi:DNA-binding transcriptional LysR family regulator